jgi:histidine kinase/DNA gyrase B/HSP90-like ATPase
MTPLGLGSAGMFIDAASRRRAARSGEGTGLGLSMSHDIIVKQHRGSIDVETEPAESGSRFQSISLVGPPRPWWVDATAVDVIQAPKLEPRMTRYELRDDEWTTKARINRNLAACDE